MALVQFDRWVKAMRIAFSMRVSCGAGDIEARDAISHDWLNWAVKREHVVIPVPNVTGSHEEYLDAIQPDAIILTGGNDFLPRPGNEGDVSEVRNIAEMTLLDIARRKGLRILGVCRGLHVINRYFGGDLTREICEISTQNHVSTNHNVDLLSPLNRIVGYDVVEVNSFHNQGILIEQVAPSLTPFAVCAVDKVVEALIHKSEPILAVQWHPERPNPAAHLDNVLVDRFLTCGTFWKSPDD